LKQKCKKIFAISHEKWIDLHQTNTKNYRIITRNHRPKIIKIIPPATTLHFFRYLSVFKSFWRISPKWWSATF